MGAPLPSRLLLLPALLLSCTLAEEVKKEILIGQLFNVSLPAGVKQHEISSSLPLWLNVAEERLEGVPTHRDVGTYELKLNNVPWYQVTVRHWFDKSCRRDTMLGFVLDILYDDVPFSKRPFLLRDIGETLQLQSSVVRLLPYTPKSAAYRINISNGTAKETNLEGRLTEVTWRLGCGSVIDEALPKLTEVQSLALAGKLSTYLGVPVINWSVFAANPPDISSHPRDTARRDMWMNGRRQHETRGAGTNWPDSLFADDPIVGMDGGSADGSETTSTASPFVTTPLVDTTTTPETTTTRMASTTSTAISTTTTSPGTTSSVLVTSPRTTAVTRPLETSAAASSASTVTSIAPSPTTSGTTSSPVFEVKGYVTSTQQLLTLDIFNVERGQATITSVKSNPDLLTPSELNIVDKYTIEVLADTADVYKLNIKYLYKGDVKEKEVDLTVKQDTETPSHEFTLLFNGGTQQQLRNKRIAVLRVLADVLNVNSGDLRLVTTVRRKRQASEEISMKFFVRDISKQDKNCNAEGVREAYLKMVRKNSDDKIEASERLQEALAQIGEDRSNPPPPLQLRSVEVKLIGAGCVTEIGYFDPPKAEASSSNDVLMTVIVPAVVITVMLVLATCIACLLCRKRRKNKGSVDGDSSSFVTKGIPVVFPDEMELDEDGKEMTSTRPLIISDDVSPPPDYHKTPAAQRKLMQQQYRASHSLILRTYKDSSDTQRFMAEQA